MFYDHRIYRRLAPCDAALGAFGHLMIKYVASTYNDTTSTFLIKFQSIAARLAPGEMIQLVLECTGRREVGTTSLLKAVLADPHAKRICILEWQTSSEYAVYSAIPLIVKGCPELISLEVAFFNRSAVDFISSFLEHPGNNLKVLSLTEGAGGDSSRLFDALSRSQVTALSVSDNDAPEFYQAMCAYLERNLLVKLTVDMKSVLGPQEFMLALPSCTRLVELEVRSCSFPQKIADLPQNITRLTFRDCGFGKAFDWSFLSRGSVQKLYIQNSICQDKCGLGNALVVALRANLISKLVILGGRMYTNATLDIIGEDISRIASLQLGSVPLYATSAGLIAAALKSPDCAMKKLALPYRDRSEKNVCAHVLPALRHPNCSLKKLQLLPDEGEYETAAEGIEATFHGRLRVFALLQGRLRRVHAPLHRMPVEMFRMVGSFLL